VKKLKIVFTKSKKRMPFLSWGIMLWTWKPYSHVALETNISWLEKPMYFQASDGAVNYEYQTHFDKKHEIITKYELEVPETLYYKMGKARLQHAGEKYGMLQNVGIFVTDILNLVNIKIDNPWKKGKNCSELIYEVILKEMYPDLKYDSQKIKPHHIEDILVNYLKLQPKL